jgi:spore germination protein YaaH
MDRRTVPPKTFNPDRRITHFIGNKSPEARKKLLVGLNMYGAAFVPARRPIRGNEYLDFLKQYKPRIEWDAESEEAVIEFVTEEGKEAELWYPTLYSIRYVPLNSGC